MLRRAKASRRASRTPSTSKERLFQASLAMRRQLGLAAAQGDANAQHMLGYAHRTGQGGPADFAEARRLCGLAAAQGHADAQCMLGDMYRDAPKAGR